MQETIARPAADTDQAQTTFSKSIVVSGIRCVLTYILLPFFTPLINLAPQVGPLIGLPLGLVAIASNIYSIRRFWKADHKWKYYVTVLHLAVTGLLIVLVYNDILSLL